MKLEDRLGRVHPHARELEVATLHEIGESNFLKGNIGPLNLRNS